MRGPIDYIVVGFEGNKFDGNILEALGDALDKGIVRLVALSLIVKDTEGDITKLHISETDDSTMLEFVEKYAPAESLATDEDMDEVAELIENNCAAGLLALEHLWAIPLKQAIIDANGVLIAEGRIHPDAANELEV